MTAVMTAPATNWTAMPQGCLCSLPICFGTLPESGRLSILSGIYNEDAETEVLTRIDELYGEFRHVLSGKTQGISGMLHDAWCSLQFAKLHQDVEELFQLLFGEGYVADLQLEQSTSQRIAKAKLEFLAEVIELERGTTGRL